MGDGFTRLTDINKLSQLVLRPDPSKPGYIDCPKAIRDAFYGRPPEPHLFSLKEFLRLAWPFALVLAVAMTLFAWPAGTLLFAGAASLVAAAAIVLATLAATFWHESRGDQRAYARSKALFDAFAANPELYRDEIFKAAVARLPEVDFYGRHLPAAEAKVGRYELEVIEWLRQLGIQQEVTVENRGRPFVIHQYELAELGWVREEDGQRMNYVLDVAILWPERRIKYDIEIDDPSHKTGTRQLKDMNRDAILTARGWLVRRLNHNFLISGKGPEALKEIVGIVYFFAKYADESPLGWEHRFAAWLQSKRRREALTRARIARAGAAAGELAPTSSATAASKDPAA